MRISDWSSDVCSSDLKPATRLSNPFVRGMSIASFSPFPSPVGMWTAKCFSKIRFLSLFQRTTHAIRQPISCSKPLMKPVCRSEEHTSELQSLMRISYAVFCLKKKNHIRYIYILCYQSIQLLYIHILCKLYNTSQ